MREVGHRMRFVQDPTGIPAVGGQMVGDDAGDGKVPANLQNLVQYVKNLLLDDLI